ncbi:MAG: hypothetical protein ABSH16_08020 [Sedimentisphaerales bacterium]
MRDSCQGIWSSGNQEAGYQRIRISGNGWRLITCSPESCALIPCYSDNLTTARKK